MSRVVCLTFVLTPARDDFDRRRTTRPTCDVIILLRAKNEPLRGRPPGGSLRDRIGGGEV